MLKTFGGRLRRGLAANQDETAEVRTSLLGNESFQSPFKFYMQLGAQGGCTKIPFIKVAALLLPW